MIRKQIEKIRDRKYVLLETSNTDIRTDVKILLNYIDRLEKEISRLNENNEQLSQSNNSSQHAFKLIYQNITHPKVNSKNYIKHLITQISRQQMEVR